MNEIIVEIDGKSHVYTAPSCFDELTAAQMLTVGKSRSRGDIFPCEELCLALSGIQRHIWRQIPLEKRYALIRLFDFALAEQPDLSKQLLPTIEAGGVQLIGYQAGFSNTTWEEFIYADGYMLRGMYRQAAAVLYRQQRKDYDGESDRRVPFTIYGTDRRMKLMAQVPDEQLAAFVICYQALRKRNLENQYPLVFTHGARYGNTSGKNDPPVFSWVGIHRDLMGDRFYDQHKFFGCNVHVILGRLDKVIRDGRN